MSPDSSSLKISIDSLHYLIHSSLEFISFIYPWIIWFVAVTFSYYIVPYILLIWLLFTSNPLFKPTRVTLGDIMHVFTIVKVTNQNYYWNKYQWSKHNCINFNWSINQLRLGLIIKFAIYHQFCCNSFAIWKSSTDGLLFYIQFRIAFVRLK